MESAHIMRPQSCKSKGRRFQQKVARAILDVFPHLTEDDVRSTSMGAPGEDIQMSPLGAAGLAPVSGVQMCRETECVELHRAGAKEHPGWCHSVSSVFQESVRHVCRPPVVHPVGFVRHTGKVIDTPHPTPSEPALDLLESVLRGRGSASDGRRRVRDRTHTHTHFLCKHVRLA